ncbi:MAG: HAD family hydrolase [Candidatus Wallbacteria bacterium]|nr:HAD family hydrolase [Candidatus Wallbacteria bacterium]
MFFDRDGTLTVDGEGYVGDPARVELQPGAREAVALLKGAGALLFVATNQSGVARGFYGEEAIGRVQARLEELLGVRFDACYYCPHHPSEGQPPYRLECRCRKPEPGLLERGLAEWSLEARRCYLVGDTERDLVAGRRAGLRTVFFMNGSNVEPSGDLRDFSTDSLVVAAEWIAADAGLERAGN